MKLLALASAFLACGTAALAAPRTWTASDGRTIEAEYIGRAADGESLVLRRVDTSVRVTVPLNSLSAADQAYAADLPEEPADKPKPEKKQSTKAEEMAANMPAPPASSHADVVEIVRQYDYILRGLASGDVAMNCRALRARIERDIPTVSSALDIKIKQEEVGSEIARKKKAKHEAAQEILAWLNKLKATATKIEAEAAK